MRKVSRAALAGSLLLATAACSGPQSAFVPFGDEAASINQLFWVMTIFLGLVMVVVLALAVLAWSGGDRLRRALSAERTVLAGGLVFPVLAVTALFVYGLVIMASRAAPADQPGAVRATISGEQWWWRVTYHLPDGTRLESANELRVPVGAPITLDLETADVLHSFWVPSLAGKLDMIPGRTNRLTFTASEPGIFRGQCAEYCGGAHAFMSFHVVALPKDAYDTWLATEQHGAIPAAGETERGAELFQTLGCGACHTVRGTSSAGVIGPDLTHVGGRLSLAAGTLDNDAGAFAAWIRDSQHIKPENRMPPYYFVSDDDLSELALYLESLE